MLYEDGGYGREAQCRNFCRRLSCQCHPSATWMQNTFCLFGSTQSRHRSTRWLHVYRKIRCVCSYHWSPLEAYPDKRLVVKPLLVSWIEDFLILEFAAPLKYLPPFSTPNLLQAKLTSKQPYCGHRCRRWYQIHATSCSIHLYWLICNKYHHCEVRTGGNTYIVCPRLISFFSNLMILTVLFASATHKLQVCQVAVTNAGYLNSREIGWFNKGPGTSE